MLTALDKSKFYFIRWGNKKGEEEKEEEEEEACLLGIYIIEILLIVF